MDKERWLFQMNKKLYESKKYVLVGKYHPYSAPYQFNIYHCVYTITNPDDKIQYVYEDLEESARIVERMK
jgi:hypothetical protein